MKNLVVVDDCIFIRSIVKFLIPKENWKVTCYADPAKVLSDMPNENWDALITDYDMPNSNGYELSCAAKAKNIKVIMLTANRKVLQLHPDLPTVVERLLYKPFKRSTLIEALKAL